MQKIRFNVQTKKKNSNEYVEQIFVVLWVGNKGIWGFSIPIKTSPWVLASGVTRWQW